MKYLQILGYFSMLIIFNSCVEKNPNKVVEEGILKENNTLICGCF